jgi:hypothetical protein
MQVLCLGVLQSFCRLRLVVMFYFVKLINNIKPINTVCNYVTLFIAIGVSYWF